RNFESRKHLLEYDDVMNKQREAIYSLRKEILLGEAGKDYVLERAEDAIDYIMDTHCGQKVDAQDWDLEALATDMLAYFDMHVGELGDLESMALEELREHLKAAVTAKYEEKTERLGPIMQVFERDIMLRVVDHAWKEHLLGLDHLKEGINLRGYAQRDPKQEYKKESYEAFQLMKERIEDQILKTLFRMEPMTEEQLEEERRRRAEAFRKRFQLSAAATSAAEAGDARPQTVKNAGAKVGRNDPCPCGSGKKYKKCHGATAAVS
ncbi:MAG TPA: SEC-C metal-binding domain-containing protein, partial [Thermoanaerobaculia bacterium]|nr:SEC-C metal-binding domain-containing protein [Thermoanaerobaculia bacterium]